MPDADNWEGPWPKRELRLPNPLGRAYYAAIGYLLQGELSLKLTRNQRSSGLTVGESGGQVFKRLLVVVSIRRAHDLDADQPSSVALLGMANGALQRSLIGLNREEVSFIKRSLQFDPKSAG